MPLDIYKYRVYADNEVAFEDDFEEDGINAPSDDYATYELSNKEVNDIRRMMNRLPRCLVDYILSE